MKDRRFFDGYVQKDIQFRQFKIKSPLYYSKLNFMAAVFSADLATIRELMPDERYHPIRIAPGRGLAAIHCLEYEQSDVGPYNELSLSFPIQYGEGRLPGHAALLGSLLFDRYHAYVQELPVNTDVAFQAGIEFFNFPKYLADISFHESATHRICTLRDKESLDLIAEFEGRKLSTRSGSRKLTLNTYPKKEGQALHARVRLNLTEYAISYFRDYASLTPTRHPRAAIFEKLGLGRPVMYFYVPRAQGILFMPEKLR